MSAQDEALLRTPHSHKEALEQFALILYTASEAGPGTVLEVVDSFLRGCASGGRRLAVRFADAAEKQAEAEAADRISRLGPLIAGNLVRSPRAMRGVLAGLANEIALCEAGGDLAARPYMILVQRHLRLLRELAGQVAL